MPEAVVSGEDDERVEMRTVRCPDRDVMES